MNAVNVNYDDEEGVLYIKRQNCHSKCSLVIEENPNFILTLDKNGKVIGAMLLGASSLKKTYWRTFEGRNRFPKDIWKKVDQWISLT